MEGNFSTTESIRMDGHLVGDLTCGKKLVIGNEGSVKGKVKAQEAVVMVVVEGELHVEGMLHLKEHARVSGAIRYGKLQVDQGAVLEGETHRS